jgi:hypothetical protein
MRSKIGFAAAIIMLLAVPVAFVSQLVVDGSAELMIHLAVGTGCVVFAVAILDFGLARWATWIGAAAAGAFGAIFLLQALSQAVANEALATVAFDVLGQEIERFLPYAIVVWFVALLWQGSSGKSRVFGGAVMAVVIGVELVSLVGPSIGVNLESQKLLFLLPFVWLLIESAERRSAIDDTTPAPPRVAEHSRESVA